MTKESTVFGVCLLAALGTVSACVPSEAMRTMTAGFAPCNANEISIYNGKDLGGIYEWDATCRDEHWHCAGLQCRRTDEPPNSVAVAPTAAPPPKPAAPKPTWVTYESEECGVSARFPKKPTASLEEASNVHVDGVIYEKADRSGSMGLGCMKVDRKNVPQAKLLDDARNGMIKETNGTLVSEKSVIGGREVRFRTPEGDGVARLYLVDQKFLFAMLLPVGAFPEKTTQHFLDSVHSL